MRANVFSLLVLLTLGFMTSAQALTFVQMPDQVLLNQAATVLEGEVVGTVPFLKPPRSYTVYRVDVSQYLKGYGAAEVEVWVPGSIEPDYAAISHTLNETLVLPGTPRFAAGDQVLLFLNPRGDGTYGITQSALGVFYQQTGTSGNSTARRRLTDSYELPGTGLGVLLPAADQLRDWEKFTNWLALTGAGGSAAPSYWNATEPGDEPTTGNFTTLQGPAGNPSRWFQFDAGQAVPFRANSNGQTGLPGGGFSQFQSGITAWVNDTGSRILYSYGGTTSASDGLEEADGINAILFNDPNNETPGAFSCTTGGVIATGGFRTSGTGTHGGAVFNRISEADIVINDNAGCFLADNGGSNAAEVFAHELGHTLGLGHSCGEGEIGLGISDCTLDRTADDALMRATPHTDGRGADLRADDEAGAAFLYAGSSTGGGGSNPPPAAADSGADGGGGGGSIDLLGLFCLSLFALLSWRWQAALRPGSKPGQ